MKVTLPVEVPKTVRSAADRTVYGIRHERARGNLEAHPDAGLE